MQRHTLYQGSGSLFKKHDRSHVGSGDNTAYLVHGHHLSANPLVAQFYAERTDISRQGGYLYEVAVTGNFLHEGETLSHEQMEDYVRLWYDDRIVDALIEDIQEKTHYESDETTATKIATGLLTGNETEVSTREMLDDVNYGGWDGFQAEHQEYLSNRGRLSVPIDFEVYVDVGRMFYVSALDATGGVHQYAQNKLMSCLGLDGLEYENFGNGLGSHDDSISNFAIWNDDSLHILSVKNARDMDMSPEELELDELDYDNYRPSMRR